MTASYQMGEKAYTINADDRNRMFPPVSRRAKSMKKIKVITSPRRFVAKFSGPVPGQSRLSSQKVALTTGRQKSVRCPGNVEAGGRSGKATKYEV